MTRFLLFALLALSAATCAATTGNHPYDQSAAGQALIRQLVQHGVDAEQAKSLLADAVYQPKIVAAMRSPAESTLTWKRYRRIFLDQKRIRGGAVFIAKHQKIFDAAEKTYGVPAPIIAAIIGVETRYGGVVGTYRVLDALATLAFDYPPRAKFFTKQLGRFIQLCLAEHLDCRNEVGSYAGAMGWPQFIPTSYQAYAVDFNHNGSRDLWNEPADIIGSVANYLHKNGWQRGGTIAMPATVTKSAALTNVKRSRTKTRYHWADLADAGIRISNPPATDTAVGLLEYKGARGTEYWVGLPNFFVITTYNRSPLYAMAVYQLSREIAALHGSQAQAGS